MEMFLIKRYLHLEQALRNPLNVAGAQNYMNGAYYLKTTPSQRRERSRSPFFPGADGCHMQEAARWHYIPSLNPVSARAAPGIIPQLCQQQFNPETSISAPNTHHLT